MTAHQLRCAWRQLCAAPRAPDPDYWPTCPLCRSRDWVRIESWARWPVCSRPNCVYRRALRKTVITDADWGEVAALDRPLATHHSAT